MEQVRQGDVVSKRAASDMVRSLSRLGGDEFSILLTDMTRTENAEIVVRRLRSVFDTPFMLPGRNEITITASVGVAVYPDDGETSDQLIKNAGAASSFVKKQGGNGHQFFSDEVDARSRERVALEMDLRKAIGRGELEMHYQPKMSADGEQVVGVEALLRWKHSERGYISPMVFIPIAEEIGFISSIGDWVILTVCKQARAWLDEGITLESISLNVSPQQLHSGDLATFLKDTLQRNHLPDGLITVELTESLAMDSNMDGESILMSLKNAGVNLSIDDFGTGYSNLGYLKQLPFDELKIDRSFLNNIPSDSDEVAIVSAITTMSHALGLKVVAEGVEESEQHEFLRDLGVETIQGFLFSKPLPSNEVSAFIKSKNNVQ